MKKPIPFIFSGLLVFLSIMAVAQRSNMIPLNIQKAYQDKTRSLSGAPGPDYWQNHSKYRIESELLAGSSDLQGKETIVYFNESPDSLKRIVLRLYPDIYKKGAPRNWAISPDAVGEGMVIEWLKINGDTIDLSNRKSAIRTATNLNVFLPGRLFPGDSLQVDVKWHFHVSEISPVRMGNYGDNRFFIAYWYPQMAVYDDIDGWTG